jgi:hypothetical protein
MEHLRWEQTVQITYRPDYLSAGMKGQAPKGPVTKLSGRGYHDVWISPEQTVYRLSIPAILESGKIGYQERDVVLTRDYAAVQDANESKPGHPDELHVGLIEIIRPFGDPRTYDVNQLQGPQDTFWTRTLMTGHLPASYDGIPLSYDGHRAIWKNYGSSQLKLTVPTSKYAFEETAEYVNGKVNSIVEINSFNDQPLMALKNLAWKEGRITAFDYEAPIVTQNFALPTSNDHYQLVSVDQDPCPVKLQQGARVFDYRLCPSVALNDFPPKGHAPKTYRLHDRLPTLAELQSEQDAGLPSEAPKALHQIPWWTCLLAAIFFAGAFCALFAKQKDGPAP